MFFQPASSLPFLPSKFFNTKFTYTTLDTQFKKAYPVSMTNNETEKDFYGIHSVELPTTRLKYYGVLELDMNVLDRVDRDQFIHAVKDEISRLATDLLEKVIKDYDENQPS